MNTRTQKQEILTEFGKLATALGTQVNVSDNYCSISKSGVTLRAIWSVDGISGVFVTLLKTDAPSGPFKHGYGLSYLVDFRGGNELDREKAKSADLKAKVELTKKYAVGFLDGSLKDFDDFADFATTRVQANIEAMPPLPTIKTNKTVRAEWI
jgi:hypothetical protein